MELIIAGVKLAQMLEKHRRLISKSPELSIMGAVDSGQLLDLHREHQARLLILDTKMAGLPPDQICRRIRADDALRRVSLIAIGSSTSVETLSRCMANRSFVRPLQKDDFLGAVRSLISVAARKDYRVLISLQLNGKARGTPFFGRSENISSTGILFTSNRALELGEQVDLMLVLPGQGQVNTKAEILRVETPQTKETKCGARFVDPARQTFRMLEDFIEKRLR
jgi:DNA-binding NarL/FixJ family response regulator